jgi:hypothetical protein
VRTHWFDFQPSQDLNSIANANYAALTLSSGQNEFGRPPTKGHFPTGNGDAKNVSVFVPMAPAVTRAWSLRTWRWRQSEQFRHILGRANINDAHVEKFSPGKSILLDGSVVDVKKSMGLTVKDPHRVCISGERNA